ncbi:MAG: 3-hydroxyacyl-CoA dehydrogenase, binding domain [Polaromonas sp.]|nr:3-hydroxyacyl-CoA dehydrogenase, binding domain [Polaromonas sp.]
MQATYQNVDIVGTGERLDIKKMLFAELAATLPAATVLASHTSSLSIAAI